MIPTQYPKCTVCSGTGARPMASAYEVPKRCKACRGHGRLVPTADTRVARKERGLRCFTLWLAAEDAAALDELRDALGSHAEGVRALVAFWRKKRPRK
jgi:hypothetical protein